MGELREQYVVPMSCWLKRFVLLARRTVCLRIRWVPMNEQPGPAVAPAKSMKRTISWWNEWTRQCTYRGPSAMP